MILVSAFIVVFFLLSYFMNGKKIPMIREGNQLIVKDEALARLHRQGLAKEFEIKGQETIRIEGIVGETSGTVSRGGGR